MKLKNLFVLVGPPGSGKSTWVKEYALGAIGGFHASRDAVRFSLLKDGESYFSHEPQVYAGWIEQIKEAIDSDEYNNIFADATNLSVKRRKELFQAIDLPHRDAEVHIVMVIFYPSLSTCIERNSGRSGYEKVPNSAIVNMYKAFEAPERDELLPFGLNVVYDNIIIAEEEDINLYE